MGKAACWRKVRPDFWISLPFSPIFSRSGSTVWIPAPASARGRLCAGMTGLGRDSAGPEEGSGGCGSGSGCCQEVSCDCEEGSWVCGVGLGKVFVRAAFSHQTSCCLSGLVGFAHVQRTLSSTDIMVKECFPSWEGATVSRSESGFAGLQDLQDERRPGLFSFPAPHPRWAGSSRE